MHPMGRGRDPPYMQDKARNPCLWGPGGRTRSKPLLDQRHAVTGARQLHLDARQRAALAAELGRHGTGLTGPAQGLPAGREPAAAWGGDRAGGGGPDPMPTKGGTRLGQPSKGLDPDPVSRGGAASPPCPGAPGTSSSFQSSLFSSRFLPGHGPESPTTPLHPHHVPTAPTTPTHIPTPASSPPCG